jgi:hypothetical protein
VEIDLFRRWIAEGLAGRWLSFANKSVRDPWLSNGLRRIRVRRYSIDELKFLLTGCPVRQRSSLSAASLDDRLYRHQSRGARRYFSG